MSIVVCRPPPITYTAAGDVFGITLMSDLHIGAPNIDYKLIKQELDVAEHHGDRIILNGDIVDMILPKDHKRYTPDSLHPRLHGSNDVINHQIAWAAEVLQPYANQIDVIGVGNHETAVERHHSIDVTKLIIYELNKHVTDGHVIHYGGYTGFVDYRLRRKNSKSNRSGNDPLRYVVYYHHGSGGDAPVTGGSIDQYRKLTWVGADLITMGHKHTRHNRHVQTIACPLQGTNPVIKDVRLVTTGSYFDTYQGITQDEIHKGGRRSNYAADKGLAPQGKGGARVELTVITAAQEYSLSVKVIT